MTEEGDQRVQEPEPAAPAPEERLPQVDAAEGAQTLEVEFVHKIHAEKFLQLLRMGASVGDAAKGAGVCRKTAYNRRAEDPAFAAAWDDAVEVGTDRAETVLAECALKARTDPKYQTSLIFLLKNRRPHVWRDVHDLRHTGSIPSEIVIRVIDQLPALTAGSEPVIDVQAEGVADDG
jgi:hypothetical protein